MSKFRGGTEVPWVAWQYRSDFNSRCGGVLPAFMVGKPLRDFEPGPLPMRARSRHRRHVKVGMAHQYGGDACRNTGMYGLVLPLHANLERSKNFTDEAQGPIAILLDALRLRAESVTVDSRTHPELPLPLRPMRTGDEWSASELKAFADTLAASFTVPAPTRGWEALIEFGTIDPAWLEGWTAALFDIDEEGFARPTERKRLRAGDRQAGSEPQLWLLWENCD